MLKTLREQRRNGLSTNTLLDHRFSARPLRRSFGAPLTKKVMSHSRDGPGGTAPLRTNILLKSLLMPLFLMGCFPVDFQDVKRPLRTKSVKRPIKVGKRPINEGKRPIKAKVLVGVSVGSLMDCFRAPPPWRKTAPLKRPIKRSMIYLSRRCGSPLLPLPPLRKAPTNCR